MATVQPSSASVDADDDARLASLGYTPQLNRVLRLFANFSVAFTYLSPMVGIYSLFVVGVGTGGAADGALPGGCRPRGVGVCAPPVWCAAGGGATIPWPARSTSTRSSPSA